MSLSVLHLQALLVLNLSGLVPMFTLKDSQTLTDTSAKAQDFLSLQSEWVSLQVLQFCRLYGVDVESTENWTQ